MIPFASQRGLGQDLATHLLNAHDNEVLEVAELRGAVVQDLHGAFCEWEVQADCLTRCQNYLYSLSVNPDPTQGPLTRDQYLDYINRVEDKLGLTGQPRAIVFHEKYGREHCHVVWSRIDIENEKAVHMAFDHDKLMMVTRQFARDHDLELPEGYFKDKDGKGQQVSLYEMQQQKATGLSKENHIEQVTAAWQQSDNPQSFVQVLSRKGYILATGNRPYVLVDFYGGMHALPRLINDQTVRTKDIRAFLENEFPPESLPSVDEAKNLVAKHRNELEQEFIAENRTDELAQLKNKQQGRRQKLEAEKQALEKRQRHDRRKLSEKQQKTRAEWRSRYISETKRLKIERNRTRPKGLAGFLGRVTGVELMLKKIHRYQDKKRLRAYLNDKTQLKETHRQQNLELQRRQEMRELDMKRKFRALDRLEKRERRSLEESLKRDLRIHVRGGKNQVPSLELKPETKERLAALDKSENRNHSPLAKEEIRAAKAGKEGQKNVDCSDEFTRAVGLHQTEESGRSRPNVRRYGRKRERDNDLDRGR